MDDLEPLDDLPAKIAFAQVLGDSELGNEAFWPKERNSGHALCSPTAPHLPVQQAQTRSLPAKVIGAANEGVCRGSGGWRIRQGQSEAMRSLRIESPTIAEPHCAPASDSATLRRRTSSFGSYL